MTNPQKSSSSTRLRGGAVFYIAKWAYSHSMVALGFGDIS